MIIDILYSSNCLYPKAHEVYRGGGGGGGGGRVVYTRSFYLFRTNVYVFACMRVSFFPPKISQRRLDLEFCNLVQTLGMTYCIV